MEMQAPGAANTPRPGVAFITREGTRYVAKVMHADQASRDRHEEMGFFDGWNTCIDQLEALARERAPG